MDKVRRVSLAIVSVGLAAVLPWAWGRETGGRPTPTAGAPLGQVLPDARLRDLAGGEAALHDAVTGPATILAVLSQEDLLACGDFLLELRIIKNAFPGIRQVVVGVGPDTAFLGDYFRRQRAPALLDPTRALERALGLSTPLVALLNEDGRAVFVDQRSGPEASAFPVSRVLTGLLKVLDRSSAESSPSPSSSGRAESPQGLTF